MTSPHDQPLSRRAARRAEQGEQPENGSAESFAQPVSAGRVRSGGSSSTPASVPSSAPSDMTYRTQVRPRVPHYDDRSVSAAPAMAPAPVAPPVAPPAMQAQETERVRRRDFRPPTVTDQAQSHVAPVTFDAPLEYHTQRSPRPDAAPSSAAAAGNTAPHVIETPPVIDPPQQPAEQRARPVGTEPVEHGAPIEQTLSRRQLRELRAAESSSAAPSAVSEPILIEPVAVEPIVVESVAVASIVVEPVAVEPVPVESVPVESVPVESVPVESVPVESVPFESTSTGSHWSVGIHDNDDPFENTFSREVRSTSSLSTNALVLPQMPTGGIAGPVAGTGEIIVTGMIAVSGIVASTGTVPTLHDSPDLDDLFDDGDHEVAAPDSAPVSALKAISSHSATHTVMTGKPSSGNTVTTVLVATTVVMAVVAIGLFVVAAMNGLF